MFSRHIKEYHNKCIKWKYPRRFLLQEFTELIKSIENFKIIHLYFLSEINLCNASYLQFGQRFCLYLSITLWVAFSAWETRKSHKGPSLENWICKAVCACTLSWRNIHGFTLSSGILVRIASSKLRKTHRYYYLLTVRLNGICL